MSLIPKHRSRPDRRCRGEQGAALVEFTLVSVLLLLLVFGIINFGLLLSFKQDMTRAAAEGARAGAVAASGEAEADADDATDEAVRQFSDRFKADGCGTDGMTCEPAEIHDCGDSVPDTNLEDAKPDCVIVELVYDYRDHPLVTPVPLLSSLLPAEVKAASVARVNE